jgi:hypothetical protein
MAGNGQTAVGVSEFFRIDRNPFPKFKNKKVKDDLFYSTMVKDALGCNPLEGVVVEFRCPRV